MTDNLSTKDLSLLKEFFNVKFWKIGKSLHDFINEHKETPCSVLKILIKEPKSKIDFAKTIIITLIAFGFGFAANYESQGIFVFFDILTTIAILSMLLSLVIIIFWIMDFVSVPVLGYM